MDRKGNLEPSLGQQ